MDSSAILSSFTAMMFAYVGVIAVCIGVPLLASFLLDGLVILLTQRRLAPLLTIAAILLTVAAAGAFAWRYGIETSGTTTLEPGTHSVAGLLLPFASVIALVGFGGRQFSRWQRGRTGNRRRTARARRS